MSCVSAIYNSAVLSRYSEHSQVFKNMSEEEILTCCKYFPKKRFSGICRFIYRLSFGLPGDEMCIRQEKFENEYNQNDKFCRFAEIKETYCSEMLLLVQSEFNNISLKSSTYSHKLLENDCFEK